MNHHWHGDFNSGSVGVCPCPQQGSNGSLVVCPDCNNERTGLDQVWLQTGGLQPKSIVTAINEIWSMDFVSDALFDGRRLRALTVVDNYTRESLAIEVGQSLKGEDVVRVLDAVVAERGTPQTIKVDNGSEFISKAMDRWAYEHGVELDFSRPGTPTDNAKVESFNGRFRQECLNEHWFLSLDDARSKIADWRQYYNESRPHSALRWATPAEFARQARKNASTDEPTTPEISTSGGRY
jgi:putative transposase